MKTTIKANRIAQISAQVHVAAGKANRATAEAILEKAYEDVPRDTGNLADTLQIEGEDHLDLLVTAGGPTPGAPDGAPYADFVERGTRRMAPRPYLTPATEGEREGHKRRVAQAVKEAIEGV